MSTAIKGDAQVSVTAPDAADLPETPKHHHIGDTRTPLQRVMAGEPAAMDSRTTMQRVLAGEPIAVDGWELEKVLNLDNYLETIEPVLAEVRTVLSSLLPADDPDGPEGMGLAALAHAAADTIAGYRNFVHSIAGRFDAPARDRAPDPAADEEIALVGLRALRSNLEHALPWNHEATTTGGGVQAMNLHALANAACTTIHEQGETIATRDTLLRTIGLHLGVDVNDVNDNTATVIIGALAGLREDLARANAQAATRCGIEPVEQRPLTIEKAVRRTVDLAGASCVYDPPTGQLPPDEVSLPISEAIAATVQRPDLGHASRAGRNAFNDLPNDEFLQPPEQRGPGAAVEHDDGDGEPPAAPEVSLRVRAVSIALRVTAGFLCVVAALSFIGKNPHDDLLPALVVATGLLHVVLDGLLGDRRGAAVWFGIYAILTAMTVDGCLL